MACALGSRSVHETRVGLKTDVEIPEGDMQEPEPEPEREAEQRPEATWKKAAFSGGRVGVWFVFVRECV